MLTYLRSPKYHERMSPVCSTYCDESSKGVNSNLLSLAEKYRWKGEYFPQDEKTRRNFNKSIKS